MWLPDRMHSDTAYKTCELQGENALTRLGRSGANKSVIDWMLPLPARKHTGDKQLPQGSRLHAPSEHSKTAGAH